MSVYHNSFTYMGINSKDRNLMISHFEPDSGEHDAFLGMEPIYTESADGTRRLDYGAKYNNVATFRITMIRPDGGDFPVKEVRDHLKWLTGVKKNSPLDLLDHWIKPVYGLGKITNREGKYLLKVEDDGSAIFYLGDIKTWGQVKALPWSVVGEFTWGDILDGIDGLDPTCNHAFAVYVDGVALEKEEWVFDKDTQVLRILKAPDKSSCIEIAYGHIRYSFICRVTNVWQQKMDARTIGLVIEATSISPWAYSAKQTISEDIDGSKTILIKNDTDDLYGNTPVNITFVNNTGSSLKITNHNTGVITTISNLKANEVITMTDNMMITSDSGRVMGGDFNFCFQQLAAKENKLTVEGNGTITFEYVLAYKIGDCSIDLDPPSEPLYFEDGSLRVEMLEWNRITGTPTTYQDYGITNVYSKVEVNNFVQNLTTDVHDIEKDVSDIDYNIENIKTNITEVENNVKNIETDIATIENNVYSKDEVDSLIAGIEIDEDELSNMLLEELG